MWPRIAARVALERFLLREGDRSHETPLSAVGGRLTAPSRWERGGAVFSLVFAHPKRIGSR
jgi:hypothetical protein